MSQKGSAVLIILIVVVLAGLAVGVYFISQKTGIFSFAGSAQIAIPYASPSLTPKATPANNVSLSAEYENPFEEKSAYENPFEEAYQNPLEDL